MTALRVEEPVTLLRITDSLICAGCDGQMVVTKDAIGRERRRCPKCTGVAAVRRHPDEVLLPQGLVRASLLPPIGAGQLRCQMCARGVDPKDRFCATCQEQRTARAEAERLQRVNANRSYARLHTVYAVKVCVGCESQYRPTGPRALYCETCRANRLLGSPA
jgi:hypothetical protein